MNVLIVTESKLIGRALTKVCGLIEHVSYADICFDLFEAERFMEKNRYNCIIIYMPFSSIDLSSMLNRFKTFNPEVLFIFLASYLNSSLRQKYQAMGIHHVLDLADEFENILPILEAAQTGVAVLK